MEWGRDWCWWVGQKPVESGFRRRQACPNRKQDFDPGADPASFIAKLHIPVFGAASSMFQLRDHVQEFGRRDFVQRRLNASRRKPSLGGGLGGRFDNE